MRTGAVTLGEVAAHFPMLTVECRNCGRHGRYATVRLARQYGAGSTVQPLPGRSQARLPGAG